jgi:hypothetical protein
LIRFKGEIKEKKRNGRFLNKFSFYFLVVVTVGRPLTVVVHLLISNRLCVWQAKS